MSFEYKVKESFIKAKEDAEGMKNELAFAMRRIAKIEEVLNKQAVLGMNKDKKHHLKNKKGKKKKL